MNKDYKKRLIEELLEIDHKIQKILNILKEENMSDTEFKMLDKQVNMMIEYENILIERIKYYIGD